jgi:uncharacterized protein RhaS with RHS repeats
LGAAFYTYPADGAARPHALLTAPGRSYAYDANGNVASDGTRAYAWDGENRLLSVGGTSFVYAPDGTWLKKTSGSTTTLYLGADAEKTGSTWTKYLTPDAVKVGSTVTWLVRDHLQSIRLRTNATGAQVEQAGYGPYGVQSPALSIEKGYIDRSRARPISLRITE